MELTNETQLEIYYQMLRSRRLDERAWVLHRQGKITFHISAIGHEATQAGIAYAVRRGHDWIAPYYRDLALLACLGMTSRDFALGIFGKAADPTSHGRQMPSHWSWREMNVISTSATVATQVPHAAGIALAAKLRGDDAVAVTTIGEGSTSQGEWYEGLNWAGVHKLPLVCVVENNGYAISVPQRLQMAVPDVADRAAGLGLAGVVVDGNDLRAVLGTMRAAVERARRGEGATLVEAKTYRPVPHSSDDDDRSYRSREEVEEWKRRDPIRLYRECLEAEGILTPQLAEAYEARAVADVDDAIRFADAAPYPALAEGAGPVYAEDDHA